MRNSYKFIFFSCMLFWSCGQFGNQTYNSSDWLNLSYEEDGWEVKLENRRKQLKYVLNNTLKQGMDIAQVQKILGVKKCPPQKREYRKEDFIGIQHEFYAERFNEKDLDDQIFSHLICDLGTCYYEGHDFLMLQFDTNGKYTGVFAVGHYSIW